MSVIGCDMVERQQDATQSLREVIEAAIRSQGAAGEERRLLVAQRTLPEFMQRNSPLPPGITCTQLAMKGKRVPVRGRVGKEAKEPISANWPEDDLIEIRAPYFVYAIDGQADLRVGDFSLHLQPGHFCLLPSEVPRTNGHHPHLDGARRQSGHCDLLWMRAWEGALELWICHSRGSEHWGGRIRQRVVLNGKQLWFYISTLAREAEEKSAESTLLCQSLLKVILVMILRELRSTKLRQTVAIPIKSESGVEWNPIEHACNYIVDNLQEHLTIQQVARATYMSSSQFRQRFRQETGQTFTEYLTQCRRKKAQAMLRDTEWTVAAIASLVGINPSHLRRLFMRYDGISPQDYRRQSQAKHRAMYKLRAARKSQQISVAA